MTKPELSVPSKFWRALSERDQTRLDDNWKRTIATHYFTWTRTDGGSLPMFARLVWPQYIWLLAHVSPRDSIRAFWGAWRKPASELSLMQSVEINVLAKLAWFYARRTDSAGLTRLAEPALGNPFDVKVDGRCISQDLANSIVEANSVKLALGDRNPGHILEVGAGYGRNAFVLLNLYPEAAYTVVDIEPALTLCRSYLSELFPRRELRFVTPDQVNLIASSSVSLFINISSFGEMLPAQVDGYFGLADRATRGVFYHKQWKVSRNLADRVIIRRCDYPVRPHWTKLFDRTAKIQPLFFEAAYEIPEASTPK